MTDQPSSDSSQSAASEEQEPRVVIIGPNGMAVSGGQPSRQGGDDGQDDGPEQEQDERHVTDLVEQPAKGMRIGGGVPPLLEEGQAAPPPRGARGRAGRGFRPPPHQPET